MFTKHSHGLTKVISCQDIVSPPSSLSFQYADDQSPLEKPQFSHIQTVDVLNINQQSSSQINLIKHEPLSLTNDFPCLSENKTNSNDTKQKKLQNRQTKKKIIDTIVHQSEQQHSSHTTSSVVNNTLKPEINSLIKLIKSIQFNDNMDIECLLYAKVC